MNGMRKISFCTVHPSLRNPNHTQTASNASNAVSNRPQGHLVQQQYILASNLVNDQAMPKVVKPTFPGSIRNASVENKTDGINVSNAYASPSVGATTAPKDSVQDGKEPAVNKDNHSLHTHTALNGESTTQDMTDLSKSNPSTPQSTINGGSPMFSLNYQHETTTAMTPMAPPPREPKTSSRRVKNYTLSDGTVVSGKGLGRGRPGVKRGPRNLKYQEVDGDEQIPASAPSVTPTTMPTQIVFSISNTNPTGQKRKRSDSDSSNIKARRSTSTSLTSESRESSIEYNPRETETRSGRKPQKPVPLVPQATMSSSPVAKKPKLDTTQSGNTASPSTIKTHPKIKRRIYRGREQFALCEHCLRGHGPVGNVIVFCDACNKCWHQRCHEPQVPKEIVADVKAEWFCTDCDKILHGGKKGKKNSVAKGNASSTATTGPVVAIEPPRPMYGGPLIGGAGLSKEAKRAYLNTLSKDSLVNLIISSSELAPTLPLFQVLLPPPTPVPQAQFTSNYVTPVSRTPTFATAKDDADADDDYEEYFDEHAALYPKPGNGVKLPPETVDMHMLLEGRTSRTFSHWVRGMPGTEFNGSANLVVVRA